MHIPCAGYVVHNWEEEMWELVAFQPVPGCAIAPTRGRRVRTLREGLRECRAFREEVGGDVAASLYRPDGRLDGEKCLNDEVEYVLLVGPRGGLSWGRV